MNSKFVLLLSVFFFLSFFLLGCVEMQKKELPKETLSLEPATSLKFSDVPVPTGFRFLAENSYLVESGNLRSGLLKFTGKAIGDQIVNFYREQMSMYGWRLLNLVEYGDRILNFEKESESCIITIQPKGSKIDLLISVAPKPSPVEKRIEKKTERPIK